MIEPASATRPPEVSLRRVAAAAKHEAVLTLDPHAARRLERLADHLIRLAEAIARRQPRGEG